MTFETKKLSIPDVVMIEPLKYQDSRGFFFESFNHRDLEKGLGRNLNFVQDNQSRSLKGVIRGLHFQNPNPQGKLVRVLNGSAFDVAVDLRQGSPTFGQWVSEVLSDENMKQLWIPEGFAHGFMALSETVDLFYKVTDYWDPKTEQCLIWNDPDLAIKWPSSSSLTISHKDSQGLTLKDITKPCSKTNLPEMTITRN